MNTNYNLGYLEIIIGPMKSGKTSKLIEVYKQYKYCNTKICVINHIFDTRYSNNEVVSHDGIKIPCIMTKNIRDIFIQSNILDYEVVLINEGQFFEDLYECVLDMLKNKKQIYHKQDNNDRHNDSLDSTLYKSSQEILHKRAIEERVKANLIRWNNAMMPQEY